MPTWLLPLILALAFWSGVGSGYIAHDITAPTAEQEHRNHNSP